MLRFAIAFALLLALLAQSLSPARAGAFAAAPADAEHAALHWQAEGHHHHDDGSHHVDGSDPSFRHLLAEQGQHLALLFGPAPTPALHPGVARHAFWARAGTPPVLAGPLRPPRLPG